MQSRRFGTLAVDASGPVYLLRFAERWSLDDVRVVLEDMADGPFEAIAMIADARTARVSDALHRQKVIELMRDVSPRLAHRVAVIVVVSDSPFTRAAVKALLWYHPTPHPVLTVSTSEEGLELARRHMAGAHAFVPQVHWDELRRVVTTASEMVASG